MDTPRRVVEPGGRAPRPPVEAGGRAPRPPQAPQVGTRFFWVHRKIVQFLIARFLRLRVEGLEHLPEQGGVLIVSNHLSIADPPLLATISRRPVTFMAKAELFGNPIMAMIFRAWGVFPVRRGQVDVGAVRMALSLLRDGQVLVVFPEGTRHREGLGEALPGIGYLASRSGCLVVPVGIVGTESINSLLDVRHGGAVTVSFGKPFIFDKLEAESGADTIMQNIAALLPADRRGRHVAPSILTSAAVDGAIEGA